jgi:hypothetical protein
LHANLGICEMLAIVENRKSLFLQLLRFFDHPHTVGVAGSNPAPVIEPTTDPRQNVAAPARPTKRQHGRTRELMRSVE